MQEASRFYIGVVAIADDVVSSWRHIIDVLLLEARRSAEVLHSEKMQPMTALVAPSEPSIVAAKTNAVASSPPLPNNVLGNASTPIIRPCVMCW